MSPKGHASLFPIVVASARRAPFDYQNLDVRLRLRIRARKHSKGLALSPETYGDTEAEEWIFRTAQRYGVYKWTKTGWVKERFQIGVQEG